MIFATGATPAATTVLQAFEGDGYGDWKTEGTAFGLAPSGARMDGLTAPLTAYSQDSVACSAHGGDVAKGSLTSPEFKITENYICFLIAGGKHPGKVGVQLIVDGKPVLDATGNNTLQFRTQVWDVTQYKGKQAKLRIYDDESGGWGVIAADQFVMTDYANYKFPPATKNGKLYMDGLVSTDAIPGLTIPQGTKATIVADYKNGKVTSPTALAFGEKGEIYVTETHRFRHGVPDNRDHLYWYLDDIASRKTEDRRKMHEKYQDKQKIASLQYLTEVEDLVRVLAKPGEDGKSKETHVFSAGYNDLLDGPAAGVFEYEGTVFMACIPKIWALRDKDGDGKADKPDEKVVLFDGFGVRVSFSGHDLNGFALGPDGRIYGTLGDRGMNMTTKEGKHYEMPDQGSVFRFDPDGTNFEVIHTGLRNPKELAFDEYGDAISVDNNSDQGDQARIVYVMEGADSGWTMEHQALHSFHRQIGMEERPPNRWMEESMWAPKNDKQPAYILPPVANLTSGPSGLTYHPGTGFLESEAGRFLICDYRGGAANSGIWSFKLERDGAGMKFVDSRQMNWGAAVTDVEYSWDGKLYITDFITGWESHEDGRVYSLTADKMFRQDEAEQTAELIEQGFEKRPLPGLEKLLSHADMRVRLRAELALTRRPEGLDLLTKAAKEGKDTITRLHGVWGVGVIARRGAAVLPSGGDEFVKAPSKEVRQKALKVLVPLCGDPDAEVRAQAIKMIGEAGLVVGGVPFAKLMEDDSLRVRAFAAIAAGRLKEMPSVPAIWDMLEKSPDDPYIRSAGAYALSLMGDSRQIAALSEHENPSVRLAAVVALRRLKDPLIANFLHDDDKRVAREAMMGIHDAGIEEVRPAVAALLDELPKDMTEMDWRRLLHSAFRLGDDANLQRVLKVVFDPKAPAHAREEALRLVGLWSKPPGVDQSLGRWAPLPERDAAKVRTVLNPVLPELLKLDGKLAEPALSLLKTYQLDMSGVDSDSLKGLVMNARLPGSARSEALELYAGRNPAGLEDMLRELAKGKDDELSIGAIKRLVAAHPDAAAAVLKAAVENGSAKRQQLAWQIAADLKVPGVDALFVESLAKLKDKLGVSPSALELLDAAAKRGEEPVKAALASYKAALAASTDPLAPYLGSLQGGDPKKGGQLFESHPAAQCMRCHAAGGGHGGGDAGPNLEAVGKRADAKYFLESLVNPGAKVAPGFGISTVTLKGGKTVSGLVLSDTPEHVDLDSNGKVLRVKKSDVDSMLPPVSAMPPMSAILSASEMRDIVAWLGTQKGKEPEPKKRPAPELVTP